VCSQEIDTTGKTLTVAYRCKNEVRCSEFTPNQNNLEFETQTWIKIGDSDSRLCLIRKAAIVKN